MPKKTETTTTKKVHRAYELDEDTVRAMLDISFQVKGGGFTPIDALREEYGAKHVTVFNALALRTYRLVVEVRRLVGKPGEEQKTEMGYEWADARFSNAQAKEMPDDMQWVIVVSNSKVARYTNFERVTMTCRWTNFVLAGLPVPDSDKKRVFERVNGHVLIPGYCVRSMFKKVFPLIGKTQTLADHVRSAAVRIPLNGDTPRLMPVVDEKRHQGRGVTEHESLPPGTKFQLELFYPSSEITHEQLVMAVATAGKFVRLSPARSAGYGDFELLEVNGQPLAAQDVDVGHKSFPLLAGAPKTAEASASV